MKKILFLFALIFALTVPQTFAQGAKKKVAVYMTGSDTKDSYKKVIGSKLVSAITRTDEYAAVERTADFLAALSRETDYQASGEVRDSQIAELGQKFGVRYVLVADVSELFDELFVTARLINVETGLVDKSFDHYGQAESLEQLINLSNAVASGLLGGIATGKWSTTPTHLTLCVTDDKGKVWYLTPEQWANVKPDVRRTMSQNGVCIVDNGDKFIVKMRETRGDWYSACSKGAPSLTRLKSICTCKYELNAVLKAFGGDEISSIWYWSNESRDSSHAWVVGMGSGSPYNRSKKNTYSICPVVSIPSSAM